MAQEPARHIVLADIDGTILDDCKRVSPEAAAYLRSLQDGGVPFCLVSARSPKGIEPAWNQLGFHGPTASFSGGYVVDEAGRELYSCTMPLDESIEIKRFMNEHLENIVVNSFGFDTWITDDKSSPHVHAEERVVDLEAEEGSDLAAAFDERGLHKFLLMGEPEDLSVAEPLLRERFPHLAVARSNADLTEVSAPGATKDRAVDVLCAHYGVTRADAIAFGDGHNDIPMLAAVDQSYAMLNASDEVKAAAAHVTRWTNNEDGVMRTLQELGLG